MKQGTKQDECFFKDLYQKYSKQIEEKIYTLTKNTEYGQSPTNDETIQFLLDRSIENKKEINELKQEMMDISQIYKKSIWKSSFTINFLNQLSQRGYKYLRILIYLNLIVDGYFYHTYPITKTEKLQVPYQMPFQSFFIHTIQDVMCQILFSVSVYNRVKNKQIKFDHTIVFLDIKFGKNDQGSFEQSAFSFLNTAQNDPSKNLNWCNIGINSQLVVQSNIKTIVKEKFLFVYNQNTRWASLQFSTNLDHKYYKWIPTQFIGIESYEKDFGLFEKLIKDRIQLNSKINIVNQIIKENKALLNQYANFKDSGVILDLIRNCQKLNQNIEQQQILKITEQERQIIEITQNALVIGRSGTGKTTCSLLRIYSASLLMNIRQNLFGQRNQGLLINSFDNKQKVNLRFLFTTLNQVLISEVRNYYRNLKATIKHHLTSKENRGSVLDESFASLSSIAHEDLDESFYIDTFSIIMEQSDPKQKDEKTYQEFEKIDFIQQMNDLTNEDFPGFVSIEKLLFLIDSALENSFFAQEKYQNIKQKKKRAGWNEAKIIRIGQNFKQNIYNVQQDGFDAYLDEESIYREKYIFENQDNENLDLEKQLVSQSNYSSQLIMNKQNTRQLENQQQFEQEGQKNKEILLTMIDFNYFLHNFWPLIKKQCQKQLETKIDEVAFPELIWTQIFSVIKGSQYSYLYPQQYLPQDIYEEQNKKKLSEEQLKTIYEAFLTYEEWKNQNDSFDQLDLVNYLLVQIKDDKYNGVPIHYLLVDEIQDLPHAMIELLTKVTEQGLFFCGDTAQTIMKGIGFRFQDIKQLFRNQVILGNTKFADVQQLQLSVNFRSHNSILQMANCLVSLIELFFPKQIDHLNQEISNIKGPKPYVVVQQDINLVIKLIGKILAANQENEEKINFGCNQVIIVQDEETKEKVNPKIAHALILTIYEAKGLEFEDVILYNFFSNGINQNQWDLLKYIILEDYELTAFDQVQKISKHDISDNQRVNDIKSLSKTKKLRLNPQIQAVDLTQYQNLCNELKLIYVGVTRAKRSIIIYDEDTSNRKPIQELWEKMDIVQFVDDASIQNINQQDVLIEKTDKSNAEWKKMGIKMFISKYYDQAVKCFLNCEDQFLINKSQAYASVTKAIKYNSIFMQLKNDSQGGRIFQKEKKKLIIQAQEYEQLSKEEYKLAGDNFTKINSYRNAADCYFSAQYYKKASRYYLISNRIIEAAECFINQSKFEIGAILYYLAEQYEECLENLSKDRKNHCLIIEILSKYSNQIDSILVQKYVINNFKEALQTYYSGFIKQQNKEIQNQKNNIQEQLNQIAYCEKKIDGICQFVNQQNKNNLKSFLIVLKNINNNITQIKDRHSFMEFLHIQINYLKDPILDILESKFIKYDKEKYQLAFNSGRQIEFQQTKIHFFEDIFDYFELYQIMLFTYSYYNLQVTERYYQSLIYKDSTIFKYNQYMKQLDNKITSDKEKTLQKHIELLCGMQPPKLLQFYQSQIQLGFWFVSVKQNEMLIEQKKTEIRYCQANILELAQLFKDYPFLIKYYKDNKQQFNSEMFLLEQQLYFEKLHFKNYEFQQLNQQDELKELYLVQKLHKTKANDDKDMLMIEILKQTQHKHLDQQKMDETYYQVSICLLHIINTINQEFRIDKEQSKTYQSLLNLEKEIDKDTKQLLHNKLITFLEMGSKLFKFEIHTNQQISLFKAFCTFWHLSFPIDTISNFFGSTYIFVHQLSPILAILNEEQLKRGLIISSEHDFKLFPSQIIIKQIRTYCHNFLTRYQNDFIRKMNEQYQGILKYSIKMYQSLNKEVGHYYLCRFFKRAVLKDLEQSFLVAPREQQESTSKAFKELSEIYLKKMSEDSQAIKFSKHFINSCLIMKLLHNQESNQIMLHILYEYEYNLPVRDQCLDAFYNYIIFQDYFTLCFSIQGVERYLSYYRICKWEGVYHFINSDLIGLALCLVFNFHYQQFYEECKENQQQDDNQIQEIEETEIQQTQDKNDQSENIKIFSKKIWIIHELKSFFNSQNYKINVCNEIIDISNLTIETCKILVDHLIQSKNTNNKIFQLLRFILISIDINYIELENYISEKLENNPGNKEFQKQFSKIICIIKEHINQRISDTLDHYKSEFEKITIEFQIFDLIKLKQYHSDKIQKKSNYEEQQELRNRVQQSIKTIQNKTFTNLYYAMRFLFQKSMIDKLQQIQQSEYKKDQLLFQQYEEIDKYRMKFFEILYSSVESQNSITYQSIIYQLSKLRDIEQNLDKMLQSYDPKMSDQVYRQLKELNNSISEWESKNYRLKQTFQKLEKEYVRNIKRQKIFRG